MYEQIEANRRRTNRLLFLFIGFFAAAGWIVGLVNGDQGAGLIFALLISIGSTVFSWFLGDKVVLWSSGAQEITAREQNTYVWNLVENLCIASGMPRPRIYLVSDPAMNAFATGRDPMHASIALTTGIVQGLENEELEGVIAHELSHVKNLDTRYMMVVAVLVGALSLLGDMFLRGGFRRRSDREEGGGLLMVLGIVFIIISPLVGQLIKLAISREREYLADASGALLTRYPEGLARALEKIAVAATPMQNVSQATAHLWIANPLGETRGIRSKIGALFSTHPPVLERIARLRAAGR